ncbi:Ccdc60 [Columba guinea]|nr:Ccdc60 [Columba guinea]
MPVPDAAKNCPGEAPVGANAGRSSILRAPVAADPPKNSKFKAPVVSDPHRNNRAKVQVATKVLNPRDFVRIQALPGLAQKEGKVLARSRTIYRSSEPSREQVFWENHQRRQKQFTQGLFTPFGKPYQEIGEIVYTDPKKLTLYSLGQLPQEPVKTHVEEKPPKEVAEVTANKYPLNPKPDPLEPVKRLSPVRETGKELRTLSKALAHSSRQMTQYAEEYPIDLISGNQRRHINSVKRGGDYFHILHQESLERSALEAAQQDEGTIWRTEFQPSIYSSDAEKSEEEINNCSLTDGDNLVKLGNMKKKMTLRSFTPVYTSVLIPNPPGANSKLLFRQLCAIHWLLEASTLESNSSMHSILTCWNPMAELFKAVLFSLYILSQDKLYLRMTEKCTWKTRCSPLMRKINRASTPGISQLSSQSSPRGQSPCDSVTSTIACSEDNTKINLSSSDVMTLQRVMRVIREHSSKDFRKQDNMAEKLGLQRSSVAQKNYRANVPFVQDKESVISRKQSPKTQSHNISSSIKSKSNLCAHMRQEFTAIREEAAACLHDTLQHLERSQEERCREKFQALEQLTDFRKDMERIRQLGPRAERERDEGEINWLPELLARLPESVKSDHCVHKILKKLEKYGKNPDLKIEPDAFLKALADLQVWELCSPEIAAAVEVR